MPAEPLPICDPWDLEDPPFPPRSRLYSLEPIGRGTREVESLSSYVTRLAQAHCVDPWTLMTHEIQPYIGERRLVWQWAMNGTRTVARRWVTALEALTQRRGLTALTFLPWARVLDAVPLLRRERAWCPNCYEGWRTGGTPVYEPLLWAIRGVTVCPTHRRPLLERCPSSTCRAWSRMFGRWLRPGHCQVCREWLGREPEPATGGVMESSVPVAGTDPDLARAVGALLARGAPGAGRVIRTTRKRPSSQPRDWVALARDGHLGAPEEQKGVPLCADGREDSETTASRPICSMVRPASNSGEM